MRTSRVVTGAVAAAAVAAAAVAGLGGVWPSAGDTHPPCQQLPSTAQADAALTRNQSFVDEIEALGENIDVQVGKPCPAGQDRALVEVRYTSGAEHDAVAGLLARRDGFGVPVHLVEQ